MLKKVGSRLIYLVTIFLAAMLILTFVSLKVSEKTAMGLWYPHYYRDISSNTQERERAEELGMNIEEYTVFRIKEDINSRYPPSKRFYNIFKSIITLNFGKPHPSLLSANPGKETVKDFVLSAFPKTIMLLCASQIVIIIGGILIGLKSIHPKSILGRVVGYLGPVSSGIPAWWIAGILIFFFALKYSIFPVCGYHSVPPKTGVTYYLDILYHMILPVSALVLTNIWGFAYICRNIALKEMEEDYIITAKAEGLPERKILYKHVLKASAPGILTMSTYSFLEFISSCLVVEIIFSWKGLGYLFYNSFRLVEEGDSLVLQTDIGLFVGTCFFIVLIYLASFFILETLYNTDPRIRVTR